VQETRPVPSEAERIATLSPVLLASADADLRFIHLNRAWERVLGWQPEDLAGSRIVDLVHVEDRHVLLRPPAGNGTNERSFECRMGTRDGRWAWMSTGLPLRAPGAALARELEPGLAELLGHVLERLEHRVAGR
jgi:PAS domain S-box-containing protein